MLLYTCYYTHVIIHMLLYTCYYTHVIIHTFGFQSFLQSLFSVLQNFIEVYDFLIYHKIRYNKKDRLQKRLVAYNIHFLN